MTVPVFTQNEMIDYIKSYGWVIESDAFWETKNRLIFRKDSKTVTFQCDAKYFYKSVVRHCKIFNIPPPQEHIHEYYRHYRMDKEPCYCNSGRVFDECHGQV